MRRFIFVIIIFCSSLGYSQQELVDTLDNKVITETTEIKDSVKIYSVNLFSIPENAEVYNDTVLLCITPAMDLEMKEGSYSLKFINPRSGKYWENANQIVKFDLKSDTTISADFKYFYFFETEPFNASVISNDTLMGYTPLRIFTEFKLTDNIIFRKKNYNDFVFNISDYNFDSGVKVILKPKGKINLNDDVFKNKGTQFNTERNLPAIVGLGLASITAAYFTYDFKTQANQDYDEYLLTGNQGKFDDSSQNDTYFVISLVLMQAAIGGLIYFLFFD